MSPTTVAARQPLRWTVLLLGALLAAVLLISGSPLAAHAAAPDTPGADQEQTDFYFGGVITNADVAVPDVTVSVTGSSRSSSASRTPRS